MMRYACSLVICLVTLVAAPHVGQAQHGSRNVLWFNAIPDAGPTFNSSHRRKMATYVDKYQDGAAFQVTYKQRTSRGALAKELAAARYDILILDMTNRRAALNQADVAALQQFYAGGRSNLMLDGSFAIRSFRHNKTTNFPGVDGSSAGLLMNQLFALTERGGGVLIGTDHDEWQPNANAALQALVPQAVFQGTTNPSTDGEFIGSTLLASRVIVTARDLLRHWESVPNQGEAPIGEFLDFRGQPIVLYSLVETADKPGGGRKRPYISASFSPGTNRIPIDSAEQMFGDMPTHKSRP